MPNEKRVVVVTGGASGIGEACAETLVAGGFRVVVADKAPDRARKVATRIGGVPWVLDVADDKSVEAAARAIESEVGPVYGLLNSAGIGQLPLRP